MFKIATLKDLGHVAGWCLREYPPMRDWGFRLWEYLGWMIGKGLVAFSDKSLMMGRRINKLLQGRRHYYFDSYGKIMWVDLFIGDLRGSLKFGLDVLSRFSSVPIEYVAFTRMKPRRIFLFRTEKIYHF
jgi:hypothetical protein